MTDREARTRECVRNVDTVARNLERLANRLRQLAERYETYPYKRDGGASSVAAEVVSEYTVGVGNNGTHLWQVLESARELDNQIRAADAEAELRALAGDG
jgi:hypothetical protein